MASSHRLTAASHRDSSLGGSIVTEYMMRCIMSRTAGKVHRWKGELRLQISARADAIQGKLRDRRIISNWHIIVCLTLLVACPLG